jgi:hypothetical protein
MNISNKRILVKQFLLKKNMDTFQQYKDSVMASVSESGGEKTGSSGHGMSSSGNKTPPSQRLFGPAVHAWDKEPEYFIKQFTDRYTSPLKKPQKLKQTTYERHI